MLRSQHGVRRVAVVIAPQPETMMLCIPPLPAAVTCWCCYMRERCIIGSVTLRLLLRGLFCEGVEAFFLLFSPCVPVLPRQSTSNSKKLEGKHFFLNWKSTSALDYAHLRSLMSNRNMPAIKDSSLKLIRYFLSLTSLINT